MSVDANDLRGALFFVCCLVSSSLESPPQATGSTVPGIHPIPIQMATTNVCFEAFLTFVALAKKVAKK
jgi:hypothetical protein